jgi:hypothetical protein
VGSLRSAACAVAFASVLTGCSGDTQPQASPSPSVTATSSPAPSPTRTSTSAGRVLSSLESGQTVSGVVGWQVSPRFPQAMGEAVALYYIDGRLAWRERHEPYRFHGDDAALDTRHLSNGTHTLRVEATYPDGSFGTFEATITVANNGPAKVGGYTDFAYAADVPRGTKQRVDGVPVAGLWLLSFPDDKQIVRFSPPNAEPLDIPYRTRKNGTVGLATRDCPSLTVTPLQRGGALTYDVRTRAAAGSAAAAACRGWVAFLTNRSWESLPG